MSDLVEFTPEQVALIRRTMLTPQKRKPTDDEVALFVGQCKRTGLDPFTRQIYAQYRSSHNVEKMSVQATIDGLRLVAERTGQYVGQDGPWWSDKDTDWTDAWFKSDAPRAAKVTVRKVIGGQVAQTSAVAHWGEYAQTYSQMWKGKPALMLAKCAEALALRKAFPNNLSGIYTAEEMGRADQPAAVTPAPIPASDVPNDWPGEPAGEKPAAAEKKQSWGGDTIEEPFALDIAAECKRQGLTVGQFRDLLKVVGAAVPDDLRSAEARRWALQALTLEQALGISDRLQKREKAAA